MADGGPPLVAQPLGHVHLADNALFQQFDSADLYRRAAALRAHLHYAAVLARGVDHAETFPHVVASGLFHIHVLARLAGPDGSQGMPVVGSGHGNGVDLPVLEQAAHVGVDLGFVALHFFDLSDSALLRGLVDIADGRNAAVRLPAEKGNVRAAAAAHTDHRHVHRVAGRPRSRECERGINKRPPGHK
jgi:hypothetical protein